MKLFLFLLVVPFALANGSEGDSTVNGTSTVSPNDPTTVVIPPALLASSIEDGTESNKNGSESSEGSPRLPRGTVYQIRPLNFENGEVPFSALDSISKSELQQQQLKNAPEEIQGEEGEDIRASPSGNARVKVLKVNLDDSEALEAVGISKFILASLRPTIQGDEGSKKEPETAASAAIESEVDDEPWDASYAFGYNLEDQSRHEVSDPDGNIRGYYQYVDDEGYIRKVVYTAGAGKGFVVLKKERIPGQGPPRPRPPHRRPHKGHGHGQGPSGNDIPGGSGRGWSAPSPPPPPPPPQPSRPSYPESSGGGGGWSSPAGPNRPDYPDSPPPGGRPSYPEASEGPGWSSSPAPPSRPNRPNYPDSPPPPPEPEPSFPLPGPGSSGSGWGPSEGRKKRPFLVVKIRKPQNKRGHPHPHPIGPEDEGYYKEDPYEDNGQWDGDVGYGPVYSKGRLPPKGPHSHVEEVRQPNPDAAYTFGYETEDSNRLEKQDSLGNVRGSYSYIDAEGIKRTVHYIAGSGTGFQVLSASPSSPASTSTSPSSSSNRSIRLEAPPGYVITRSDSGPSSKARSSPPSPASLSTAESEYPSSFPSNIIVYHIHPDTNSVSPWWETLGVRPRKMRRISRVLRKKQKPRNFRRNEIQEEFIRSLEEKGDPLSARASIPTILAEPQKQQRSRSSTEAPSSTTQESAPSASPSSPSRPSPESREGEREREPPRTFRHSTRVNLDNIDMKTYFLRRRPSHRAYTKESSDSVEKYEEREGFRNDPVLHNPSSEFRGRGRGRLIPNPILLQPSSERIRIQHKGTRLDTLESNLYTFRPDESEKENWVTPSPNPVAAFAAGRDREGSVEAPNFSTKRSMELTISSSTTRIPYIFLGEQRSEDDAPSSTAVPPSQRRPGPSHSSAPPPIRRRGESAERIESNSDSTLSLTEKEFQHAGVMSSSLRLMQRLGVTPNGAGNASSS